MKSLKMTSIKAVLFFIAFIIFQLPTAHALNGIFNITLANGKALDADASNVRNNNCNVQIWDFVYGNANQQWTVQDLGDNKHKITCLSSGKVLDADPFNVNRSGCRVRLWTNNNAAYQQWIITRTGPLTANGQGYTIRCSSSTNNVLSSTSETNNGSLTQLITSNNSSSQIWYFQVGLKFILKGISLQGLHNGDCTRTWGTVRVELWATRPDGSLDAYIGGTSLGNGVILDWRQANPQPTSPITNYATISNYMNININRVNLARSCTVDPNKIISGGGGLVVRVFTYLSTHHKFNDFSSDYTAEAGMRFTMNSLGRRENMSEFVTFNIKDVFINKANGTFVRKDGPMVVGPYVSPYRTDHEFRAHLDLEQR